MKRFEVLEWWNGKLTEGSIWEVSSTSPNLFIKVGESSQSQHLSDYQIKFLQDKGFIKVIK